MGLNWLGLVEVIDVNRDCFAKKLKIIIRMIMFIGQSHHAMRIGANSNLLAGISGPLGYGLANHSSHRKMACRKRGVVTFTVRAI